MSVLVGIDIGTSSIKSIVMDPAGKQLGFSQIDYSIDYPAFGYAEQDPSVWWKLVCRASAKALQQANISGNDVSGIGLSGQMHGLVALDENGNVLRPAIIWCDQRTIRQKDELETLFTQEQFGKWIQNRVSTGFQLLSLLWLRENEPEIFRRVWKIISPKDYIRYRLTGEIGSEMTDASGTSAFHVAGRTWSEPLLKNLRIDPELFPKLSEPWEICGTVTVQASAESPFVAGTPVVFGGADQPMQAIGNRIIDPGTVSCTLGTGGQLLTPLEQPVYDPNFRTHTYVHAVPDRWYLLGATLSAGLSLRWLANNIIRNPNYRWLDESAKQVAAGSDGLLFLPYLIGERTPHMDPFSRGVYFGLTLNHHEGHLIRAVLEGVAFSMRDCLEIFKTVGVRVQRIIASGGGTKSTLWKQILADVFNREIYVSSMDEQACVGAAITAGVGIGLYDSVEQACSVIVKLKDTPVVPQAQNRDLYDHQYSVYKDLYWKNRELFTRLNVTKSGIGGDEDHDPKGIF